MSDRATAASSVAARSARSAKVVEYTPSQIAQKVIGPEAELDLCVLENPEFRGIVTPGTIIAWDKFFNLLRRSSLRQSDLQKLSQIIQTWKSAMRGPQSDEANQNLYVNIYCFLCRVYFNR